MAENIETGRGLRDLLVKKPFTRVLPDGQYDHGILLDGMVETAPTYDVLHRKIVTQEDFLRELDPAGHPINNRQLYPDILQKNEDDGLWYVQEIPRYAFAMQQIILIKHLTHLCGNDIQFELSDNKVTDEKRDVFIRFRNGWANKNMEIGWYQLAKSVKATGDGALVGFMDNGKFGWKVLSFMNGDRLFPHYDLRTGRLTAFARTYCNYAEDGTVSKRYVDVWDDTYYYRFVAEGDPNSIIGKVRQAVAKIFSVNGYTLEYKEPHQFKRIPVAYKRDDNGPCWVFSEESIENYEKAFSNLAHSNHDFGLPIMYVKGEGSEEVTTKDMSYASKIMLLPSDGEIGFLNRQDASNAYKAELDKLEEMIYKQSFAVKAPELKSGDTPGVALKILYSDAFEKAMNDAQEYDAVIDDMVDIFTWGYGIESEMRLQFMNTDIRHFIEPYVHRNNTEMVTNLNMSVVGKFLSRQTASEKNPYATPNEWERICNEEHEAMMNQLLLEEQRLEIQNSANVEMQEELSDIQTEQQIKVANATAEAQEQNGDNPQSAKRSKSKGSVATGRGRGRPNTLNTDKWGNRQGENNWDAWNKTH